MATKTLSKLAAPGSLMLKVLVKKFDALRYLPKLAYGFLQFNSAGELEATDTPTVKGLVGSIQALSGAGAVNLTDLVTHVTSTGANALTLANGTAGQLKIIRMIVDGGDATLTPTTKTGFTTITFNDVGDVVVLQYVTTLGWMVVSNTGATLA